MLKIYELTEVLRKLISLPMQQHSGDSIIPLFHYFFWHHIAALVWRKLQGGLREGDGEAFYLEGAILARRLCLRSGAFVELARAPLCAGHCAIQFATRPPRPDSRGLQRDLCATRAGVFPLESKAITLMKL